MFWGFFLHVCTAELIKLKPQAHPVPAPGESPLGFASVLDYFLNSASAFLFPHPSVSLLSFSVSHPILLFVPFTYSFSTNCSSIQCSHFSQISIYIHSFFSINTILYLTNAIKLHFCKCC